MSEETLKQNPHFLIIVAPYYKHITDGLLKGALKVLEEQGATHEILEVAGAFEIPGALRMSLRGLDFYTGRRRVDAYISLGCVIRGETTHYDYICQETFRGLQSLVLEYSIALGNGVLTCENEAQALARSSDNAKNKGAEAARASLSMLTVKESFGLYPRD